MRGFAERMDVDDVERLLADRVSALDAEPVSIREAAGRVLAEDIRSTVDVPGFRRSAMDGYALRGEDTFGASSYNALRLKLIGASMPGQGFDGELETGQAVRIMTGAPVPEGADAVMMAEYCEESGTEVEVRDAIAPLKNVGAIGEDIRQGQDLLARRRRLRAQDLGVLASIGMSEVLCVRKPRVQLVVTGNELLAAGSCPQGHQIVDSNSVMLAVLIERDGGVLLPFEILPDDPDTIAAALQNRDANLVLVSGGSSVGIEDHAPRLLRELGKLDFHGVAMRPSSPAGGGRIGSAHVFLLPGNPVSCLCAYEFFAGPSLRRLGGRSAAWPHRRVRLPLARKINSVIGRTDYVRVAIEEHEVVPIATSGASILSSTVKADGVVIVPQALEGIAAGEKVEVRLYDEDWTG